MTLIQSISGMRGIIGGRAGSGLTPADVLRLTAGYGVWLRETFPDERISVVVGRDARTTGPMISMLVCGSLNAMGIDVVDAGLTTTPTVAMGVGFHKAHGGIVITASHNTKNWNALKFLTSSGEFLNPDQSARVQAAAVLEDIEFVTADKIGKMLVDEAMLDMHISRILSMPLVDVDAIRRAGLRVAVDAVNSSGGIAVPRLLEALGVNEVVKVYCEPNGLFPHNPEPLPENLTELSAAVVKHNAHVGFAVDPDVDRLAIVCEDGECFGEEYTLVAVADYVLSANPGNTVSNLSSSQALRDITLPHGGTWFSSAVGEIHVVELMKLHKAVIGGEGNGGVIYPPLHYGRDALAGIALFLSHLAIFGKTCSLLRKKYPSYSLSKNKFELPADADISGILDKLALQYARQDVNRTDGLKIWFGNEWVHLRRSNTEPIIRIYAESDDAVKAENLAEKMIADIRELLKGEETPD